MNWLKNLINLILYWFGQVKDSKPDPLPDPVPDPVPDPDPGHEESLVLLDLPQTAVKMFQAGFPGREGVLLYALGQVANGWPIPGQSEELITIASFYDQIGVWYEKQINWVTEQLEHNSKLSVTIIANDAKDRFGCRIGPPTHERFRDFGDRVQMGYFVPESEY